MASVTLAESAKLAQDMLVSGIIDTLITSDQLFQVLPFESFSGNALAYNRYNTHGDAVFAGVGTVMADGSGKTAATYEQKTTSLTTIMGDAEVNGLIEATRSNSGIDQTQAQITSKAIAVGKLYQNAFINGTGADNQFAGLINLCDNSQIVSAGDNGAGLSFENLDEICDNVKAKNGVVDFIAMNSRTRRSFKALLRALGGATIDEVVTLPNGDKIMSYGGACVFVNDYIPVNQTKGSATTATSIFAGCFDDGSMKVGISGLTAERSAGIVVENVGTSATKDEKIWRVKWYASLALFNTKALSILNGVLN